MGKTESRSNTLRERVAPEWYQWLGVGIPGVMAFITCINRADEFGLSAWVANLVILIICATCLGLVTYFRSTHASTYILVGSIALGSLAIAVVSHVVPVMAVTYGSLWAGSGLGFLIGVTLTVGERR